MFFPYQCRFTLLASLYPSVASSLLKSRHVFFTINPLVPGCAINGHVNNFINHAFLFLLFSHVLTPAALGEYL